MIMANALLVAGSNSEYKQPGASPAGFWTGLWHGIIAPITFIVSLFADGVRIYETNNNGRWYDFDGRVLCPFCLAKTARDMTVAVPGEARPLSRSR